MLTPELVRARKKGNELVLTKLDKKSLPRVEQLAQQYLDIAAASVGCTREELRQSWTQVATAPRERRLADGLTKLVEDAGDWGAEPPVNPADLRRELFLLASQERENLPPGESLDRERLLDQVADRHGLQRADAEEALYADLKGAQRLKRLGLSNPAALVEQYQLGQVQAVLLRAVKVIARVSCNVPSAYRTLFNKLKFRRLLYRIEPEDDGYRIELDGPFSLFESVTKYGLQLALVLPQLMECDRLRLEAEIRWGKARRPLSFRFEHRSQQQGQGEVSLPDDVAKLKAALEAKSERYRVQVASEILDQPGIGLCVPDLKLVEVDSEEAVYVEVMGYWSREAVWRRVELAEQGLGERVLFAVSSRLRVSEEVLDGYDGACLYVYKGVMSPVQVLKRVDALLAAGR